jgi:hypothetical protein
MEADWAPVLSAHCGEKRNSPTFSQTQFQMTAYLLYRLSSPCLLLLTDCDYFFDLFFDPENGGSMFLRNVDEPGYRV